MIFLFYSSLFFDFLFRGNYNIFRRDSASSEFVERIRANFGIFRRGEGSSIFLGTIFRLRAICRPRERRGVNRDHWREGFYSIVWTQDMLPQRKEGIRRGRRRNWNSFTDERIDACGIFVARVFWTIPACSWNRPRHAHQEFLNEGRGSAMRNSSFRSLLEMMRIQMEDLPFRLGHADD